MSGVSLIDAAELRELVTTYRDALASHREAINRLNVFPVPDGDTGTNMSLTLESVVVEWTTPSPTWPRSARRSATARSWARGATRA